jgi:hypothetical protein
VSSHHLATLLHLEEKPDGDLFSQLLNAEAMNWQMKAGMELVNGVAPHLVFTEKAMSLSLSSREMNFSFKKRGSYSIARPFTLPLAREAEFLKNSKTDQPLVHLMSGAEGRGRRKQQEKPNDVANDPNLKQLKEAFLALKEDSWKQQTRDLFSVISDRLQELGDPRGDWILWAEKLKDLNFSLMEDLLWPDEKWEIRFVERKIIEIRKKIEGDIKQRFGLDVSYNFEAEKGFELTLKALNDSPPLRQSFGRLLQSEYGFFITTLDFSSQLKGGMAAYKSEFSVSMRFERITP